MSGTNPQGGRSDPALQEPTREATSPRRLIGPLVLAMAAVAVLFGAYHLVERLWLTGVDQRWLHRLHMLRGISASLFAALVVSWGILRTSPPLLRTGTQESEPDRTGPRSEVERLIHYARWFIQMRWIAIVVATSLVVVSVRVVDLLPDEVWWPLIATLAALMGFNLLCSWLVRRGAAGVYLLHLQVYGDLLFLSVLLHFSGGIENPLSLLMLLHVIIGGIVLSRRQCYGVAVAASIFFGLLALSEWGQVIEHYTLEIFPHQAHEDEAEVSHAAHESLFVSSRVGLQAGLLFLTAYFVTGLADRLRREEGLLAAMARRALAERQLLERALVTTGAALRVVDRGGQTVWANMRWQEWFGQGDPEPVGSSRAAGEMSPARETLTDGRTRTTEFIVEQPEREDAAASGRSGRQVYQLTTAALRGPRGEIDRVVQLAQDVTEQKKTQEHMIRADRLAAVGELAAEVAHEINNPIGIISAKARLMLSHRENALSERCASELRKIVRLSDRVATIAKGLLSASRPSGAARVMLDVSGPIRQALGIVEQRARAGGVRIEDGLPDRLPAVRANPQEIEQVFLNLFLNALDAMPNGGLLSVTAQVRHFSDHPGPGTVIAVSVEDNGCGIPGQMLSRIFQPFVTTKPTGHRTGLGLAVCYGLVRSHGGDIHVNSRPGQGSRFTVQLPVGAATETRSETSDGKGTCAGRG